MASNLPNNPSGYTALLQFMTATEIKKYLFERTDRELLYIARALTPMTPAQRGAFVQQLHSIHEVINEHNSTTN